MVERPSSDPALLSKFEALEEGVLVRHFPVIT
jgi:hypothetical protein